MITITTDSATISTSEYFLASDSTTATYQTTDCYLETVIELSNMAAGDQFRIRMYEKINAGTARVVFDAIKTGAQSEALVIPSRLVGEGWEVSIIKLAGTDRAIAWSLRKTDFDVSVTQWLGTAVSTPTVAGVPNVNAKTWNDLTTVALPLTPTVAGRALDVSAGGEAGIDWANVGTPGSTVSLSATTVATVTTTTTATNVTTVSAGGITASSIAADAIGASELAADAVAEIADAVWDEARAGHVAAGSFGLDMPTTAAVDAIDNFLDTEIADIQARLPAALVSGRIDASVGAMAAATVTAAAIATDAIDADALATNAVTEITDAILALVIETGYTLKQTLRLIAASTAGKLSGEPGSPVFRSLDDSANRITATVDSNGNRSAVTHNA